MATSIQPFLDSASERMDKSVQHFVDETRGIRTGRASTGLLDNVRVDYYGQKTPIGQLANVTVLDARTLQVKPFDASAAKDIEKAVIGSGLGLNPTLEGGVLRISVPALSEDQRKKMAGRVKQLGEDAKVSMRNVRRDAIKEMEQANKDKSGDVVVTDDDLKHGKDQVQDLLKAHEAKIDELAQAKSDEIMTV
ncbi:MAG: ribosome recycling factor [Planctomycetes bacterium]|nr:ribosome recycling factor [Planctomycetota bacterium]